jgi:hypothetical protein
VDSVINDIAVLDHERVDAVHDRDVGARDLVFEQGDVA